MGYTHYWRRPNRLDKNKMRKFLNDASVLINDYHENGILLDYSIIEENYSLDFGLNGIGEDAYESFNIPMDMHSRPDERGLCFECCKTNNRPYDEVVCACLILFKHYFPESVITSDGKDEDWLPAKYKVQSLFGLGDRFKLDDSNY